MLMKPYSQSYADAEHDVRRFISTDIFDFYETYSFRNAAAILSSSAPAEFGEVLDALRRFRLKKSWIRLAGGSESPIPKAFNDLLRPLGWFETEIKADLHVTLEKMTVYQGKKEKVEEKVERLEYVGGHKIDYLKNGIALDLEWNSKDQTFDRDLYAMRSFNEFGIISGGIVITRGSDLHDAFKELGVAAKYGASTTWMGKLFPRLNWGRNGACPILVFGITSNLIVDD